MFTVSVCLSVCLWLCPQSWSCNTHHSFDPIVLNLHIHVGCGVLIVYNYFHNFRSQIKVVGRNRCEYVGKININNFCIWHFGLWPVVSKIARGQRSDPLLKIRRIAFFAVSVYIRLHISIMQPDCTTYIYGICGLRDCNPSDCPCFVLFLVSVSLEMRYKPSWCSITC